MFDPAVFQFVGIDTAGTILNGYDQKIEETGNGITICFETAGNVFSTPCGKLFDLTLKVKDGAKAGTYPILLAPAMDTDGTCGLWDKQGHEVSFALAEERTETVLTGGWSGVYQDVEHAGWHQAAAQTADDLADMTLLSGAVTVIHGK